ncbi:MAG: hypothetical protein ABIR79_00315 [Candidatus Binatia bacterium]
MTPLLRFVAVLSLLLAFHGPAAAQLTCLSDSQCADGDLCNGIEHCEAGSCVASTAALICDDGDPCTNDTCNPTAGCAHADVACPATCGPGDDGLRCSDGTACTVGDTCSGGACNGAPLACDDADACTVDVCDTQLGCTYTEQANGPTCLTSAQCASAADHTPCVADGDPCTQDGCLEGACRLGLNQIQRQCADADACNGEEFCSAVKGCEPGPPLVCDDGEGCNGVEACVPASGCAAGTPLADGTTCDDDQTCTDGDACSGGACVGAPLDCGDGDGTTSDLCLQGTGCLNCAGFTSPRFSVRFPTTTKDGTFAASSGFVPTASIVPPTDVDLILHDGATVVQQWHVPSASFGTNGNGTIAKFVDRSGTTAQGLQRLRLKTGAAGSKHSVTAGGRLMAPGFPHRAFYGLTMRAGSTCATSLLTCQATAGGKRDRCK